MPAEKKRIHRVGQPGISPRAAYCFAVAFVVLGACAAELVRMAFVYLIWP